MKEDPEEKYSIERITREEYKNIREEYEEALTEYVDKIIQQGINQDTVISLIRGMDGIIVYFKKESETEICYDYAIGLRINRGDYE